MAIKHGDFTHIEIPADDLDRAQRFYSGLFGWEIAAYPGFEGYLGFTTPVGRDGAAGAIGKRGETAGQQVRNYVQVDSIDATLPKVTELGGQVVDGKQEVMGQGWFAVLKDSEGNEFALWEQNPQQG
jgi:predicted enzyme related to lactoylglutathione lyase